MAELLYRLGRASARRARSVIAIWLALLVAAAGAFFLFSGELEDGFSIPGTATDEVNQRLKAEFDGMGGGSGTIVYQSQDGEPFTEEQKEAIGERVENAAEIDGVEGVVDPFATEEERAEQVQELEAGQEEIDDGRAQAEAAGMLDQLEETFEEGQARIDQGRALIEMSSSIATVSDDENAALVMVSFTQAQEEVDQAIKDAVISAFEDDPVPGTTVDFADDIAMELPSLVSKAEVIGVIVAGVVLVIMLGTLIGAGLPILTALIGVGIATLITMSLSGVLAIADITPILGLMLGLAVGIDYALFIVNRHRRQLKERMGLAESIGLANGTAGNAVVFAGATVLIALVGLNLTGIGFLGLMGSVGAIAIAIAVLIAVTLIPALLSLVGTRILSKRERARLEAPASNGQATSGAHAATELKPMSTVRALGRATIAIVVLGVIALPALDLRQGLPDGSSQAVDSTQYRAYTAIAENFGEGQNGPLLVIADLPGGPDDEEAEANAERYQYEVADAVHSLDDVEGVAPIGVSDDGTIAIFQVEPVGGPSSESTEELVHTLREMEPIRGEAPLGVAGMASGNIDISEKIADALPVYLTVVVGLALVILLLVFRSIFVPVVATLGFILSYFAALGGVVAVYQWGWLSGLIGLAEPGPILSFLPTIVVGILFGLAMDYMLFIGTGMREAYVHGAPARLAVARGFRAGRSVVTAAAIIMISVFGGFIFSEMMMISSIGFGLAFGVLLDAFMVRMLLVPALMHLAGDAAWWLPKWLDRILPDIDVEGARLEHAHTQGGDEDAGTQDAGDQAPSTQNARETGSTSR